METLIPRAGAPQSRGFTLVEMMVVLAVIAILALMAIPGFQDQIVRDQIRNALPLADIAKAPVAAAWAAVQAFPPDNAAAGLPVPEKIVSNHVKSVRIENGAIHVTFGNRAISVIEGRTLTLRPGVVPDAPVVPVAWVCGYAEAPVNMTAMGGNRTDIPAHFLPFACRAKGK